MSVVGGTCTVGDRAKLNGFWYSCTATNVWSIVQPTCAECSIFTGGSLNNGGYTFVSVSPPNNSKIAGDYPSAGTRYCYVYNSTENSWTKKTDGDCGTEAAGGAWYGCTVISCIAEGNTCTSANTFTIGDCCDGYCTGSPTKTCGDHCKCIIDLNNTFATGITNGTRSCNNYCTVVTGYWSCSMAPEC